MTANAPLSPAMIAPAPSATRGLAHKLFSFPVVLGTLLVVLATFTSRSRFSDPDMWWHLKTGEIIWKTHSIPQVDLFSFTTNQHAYTPHEWLAQLSIYAAYHFGGYSGLMLWLCLITSLVCIAGYVLCSLYSGNAKVAFLGAMGIWFFATVGISVRPQLLGYLCLLCELLILCLGRSRSPRWFLALPLLFVVWVNLHGSFLFGLIVLGVVLLSACLEFRIGLLVSHRWDKQRRNMLAAVFSLSIMALFLNPVGLSQLTYPLNTMFTQHIGLQYSSEWQPAPMNDVRVWALFGIAGLILIVPLLRRIELRAEELLITGLGFALAVQHERMLIVFGILVMPCLCRLIAGAWDSYDPGRESVVLNLIMMIVGVVPSVLGFPSSSYLLDQVNTSNPVKAVEFIRQSGLSGRMLNEYIYGGYLIWAAPDRKVFIDGRADVYEWTGVFGDYMDMMNIKADPGVLLDKYHIDFCLLSREEPVVRVIPRLPGWKSIYEDDRSVIFARSTNDNANPKSPVIQ